MSKVSQNSDGSLIIPDDAQTIQDNAGHTYDVNEIGIDDDGNAVHAVSKQQIWLSPSKLMMPSGKVVSFDVREKCWEAYNPSKHTVWFENTHYWPASRNSTPALIKLEPGKFAFLPHSYYTVWVGFVGNKNPDDRVTLIQNFGDMMFKGNRLPSRPDEQKLYF